MRQQYTNYGKSLGKVLLLNANYQPMSICSVEHAVVLLYLDKVDLVETSKTRALRSAFTTFPFPSVVRVKSFVNLPFKKVPLTKKNVERRDNGQCVYCTSTRDLTIDHVIPKSKGGKDSWDNWVTACKRCNSLKDDKTLEEAGMKLLKKPTRPNYIMFLKSMSKEVAGDWEPYLYT